jgi:hypothetical protein
MIKIENVDVYGWVAAIRGARNPMNSWAKTDSEWDGYGDADGFSVGPNDHRLLQSLAHAGPDHGKFLRMITVTVDLTAPLYWWKEFDTYKVGTVANSCSTMHKIHAKEFTLDDFSYEHLTYTSLDVLRDIISTLNQYRQEFIVFDKGQSYMPNKKDAWWQMIQLLPTSYNQRRTVQLNYQVLKSMYHARKNHKLDEWREFCKWIESLPYAELITGTDESN